MAGGFKVKISDGSVVGPLDDDMVMSWYEQGLIDKDTPVLPPSSKKWVRLRDVLNTSKAPAASSRAAAKEDSDGPSLFHGRIVAGALMILAGAGAVAALLAPHVWRKDLSPAPWLEIGLGLVLLGLAALHEAEWARKLVRTGVGLAAFALFPLAGILIAKGVPMDAVLVIASAWVAASGLFFLLSPPLPLGRLAASAAVVLLGAYGVFRFGVVMGAAAVASTTGGWFSTH
jgi:hypothetical protein